MNRHARHLAIIFLTTLAALTTLVATPDAAHARCAQTFRAAAILTPEDVVIPSDGAILVHLESQRDVREHGEILAEYSLVKDSTRIPLRAEVLAPGLARLVPTQTPEAGVWTVEEIAYGRKTVTFGDAVAKTPAPHLPKLNEISLESYDQTRRRRGRGFDARIAVDAVPEGVIAILGDWVAHERGAADSFAITSEGATEHFAYRSPHRCRGAIAGTIRPAPGTHTGVVYFVDTFGRVSPASGEVAVSDGGHKNR